MSFSNDEYPQEFDIEVAEYKKVIDRLRDGLELDDDEEESIIALCMTREELADRLETFLGEFDADNKFLHFLFS